MADIEKAADVTEHLIALVINQDQVLQSWLKFMLSIEASLAVGLGFILKIGGEKAGFLEQRFMPWAIGLVPAFGILAAVVICTIVVRERKWQKWYSLALTKAPAQRRIFPTKEGEVDALDFGTVSIAIISFTGFIVVGWIIVLVGLVQR